MSKLVRIKDLHVGDIFSLSDGSAREYVRGVYDRGLKGYFCYVPGFPSRGGIMLSDDLVYKKNIRYASI